MLDVRRPFRGCRAIQFHAHCGLRISRVPERCRPGARTAPSDGKDGVVFMNEKTYGNYTLCALLSAEPGDEAARVRTEYHLDCDL